MHNRPSRLGLDRKTPAKWALDNVAGLRERTQAILASGFWILHCRPYGRGPAMKPGETRRDAAPRLMPEVGEWPIMRAVDLHQCTDAGNLLQECQKVPKSATFREHKLGAEGAT